jgi:hypothetical protein
MASFTDIGLIVAPTSTYAAHPTRSAFFFLIDGGTLAKGVDPAGVKALKDISHPEVIVSGESLTGIKISLAVYGK